MSDIDPLRMIDGLREENAALRAEVERLSVFHADDEPSWRHRAEALEQENAALSAELEGAQRSADEAWHAAGLLWSEHVDLCAKLAKAEAELLNACTMDSKEILMEWIDAARAAIREEKP